MTLWADPGMIKQMKPKRSTAPAAITPASWRPVLPAWAMSLAFHAAAFLVLSLLLKTIVPAAGIDEEPERNAGIVLARRDAARERVYFEEQHEAQERGSQSPARASDAAAADSLPAAEAAPPLEPSLALPTAEGPFAADARALADVALASRGRPGFADREGEEAIIAADLAAQRGRGGPTGPPTQISLFGSAPAAGHSFVFVIDRSQSMGDAGLGVLRAAEGELTSALAALRANHKFQIIAYNKTPMPFHARGMATADEANKERAIAYVRDLAALGGTGHFAALLAATRLEPDVVFLLTDGGDPRLTNPEIDEIVRRCSRRTRITCLQFDFGPSPDDSAALRVLAERTAGSYQYIDMAARR
jgi:hypothetical protein